MKRKAAEGLASDLAGLAALDRDGLKARWLEVYGRDPPLNTSRALMVRAVAHRLQEIALGGLKPRTRRLLADQGKDGGSSAAVVPARKLTPGTRLVREWQGTTHQVIVLDDGVIFRGKQHRSLSAVARLITGARWSGPLFFGLKGGHDKP